MVLEGSDAEGVHQMRVALRRLRTICALFRRDIPSPSFEVVNSEARWLMQQLSLARDWDVFAETTVPRLDDWRSLNEFEKTGFPNATETKCRQHNMPRGFSDVVD